MVHCCAHSNQKHFRCRTLRRSRRRSVLVMNTMRHVTNMSHYHRRLWLPPNCALGTPRRSRCPPTIRPAIQNKIHNAPGGAANNDIIMMVALCLRQINRREVAGMVGEAIGVLWTLIVNMPFVQLEERKQLGWKSFSGQAQRRKWESMENCRNCLSCIAS